jgi:NAD(P) transhydrogenase subunit alpha
MRIAVAREIDPTEDRVAATPETIKKMKGLGADVGVEPDAGTKSGIPDAEFAAAGATVTNADRPPPSLPATRRARSSLP